VRIHELSTVDGFIAFDFDDCASSAGGTRYAPDVTREEVALLARAMTYKFGVLKRDVGGAKGAVCGPPEEHAELMRRYCEEIRPLVDSFTFLTGPDLGTSEADFAPIRTGLGERSIMMESISGTPIEDILTGFGVVVAVEAAAGSIENHAFAIEGFGKVGGGVAREAVRRGGRVVAVSTIEGCVHDEKGLDVEMLLSLRSAHGDAVVKHVGGEYQESPATLFDVEADVLVPGARTGVITPEVAEKLKMRWIAPAANVPYTAAAIPVLKGRRIRYLADFVCNAGALIGYSTNARDVSAIFVQVEKTIMQLTYEAGTDPWPFEGACRIAERYIETWRGPDGMPPGPPLA
jgi:glutamate dehydrogenase (NAD(P)+)